MSVCVCVYDRAVKPPFDNALSAGRPALAPGYRSQLGNAETETRRRGGEEDEGGERMTDQRHPEVRGESRDVL